MFNNYVCRSKVHIYVYGKEFILKTDHRPLLTVEHLSNRVLSRSVCLQGCLLTAQYTKISENTGAESIGRDYAFPITWDLACLASKRAEFIDNFRDTVLDYCVCEAPFG